MRQIVEWSSVIDVFLVIIILVLTFLWGYVRDKQISHQRYQHVENVRMVMGKTAILWRGSMAKYLEDIEKEQE